MRWMDSLYSEFNIRGEFKKLENLAFTFSYLILPIDGSVVGFTRGLKRRELL